MSEMTFEEELCLIHVMLPEQLRELASDLRDRFAGREEAGICTCDLGDEPEPAPPAPMDARERKWAAAKMLRPMSDESYLAGYSREEVQSFHEQYWIIVSGSPRVEPLAHRYRRLEAELAATRAFVRAAWSGSPGPTACEEEEDP